MASDPCSLAAVYHRDSHTPPSPSRRPPTRISPLSPIQSNFLRHVTYSFSRAPHAAFHNPIWPWCFTWGFAGTPQPWVPHHHKARLTVQVARNRNHAGGADTTPSRSLLFPPETFSRSVQRLRFCPRASFCAHLIRQRALEGTREIWSGPRQSVRLLASARRASSSSLSQNARRVR